MEAAVASATNARTNDDVFFFTEKWIPEQLFEWESTLSGAGGFAVFPKDN